MLIKNFAAGVKVLIGRRLLASLLSQVGGNAKVKKSKFNLLKIFYFNGYTFQTVKTLPQELKFFHLKPFAVREEKKKDTNATSVYLHQFK